MAKITNACLTDAINNGNIDDQLKSKIIEKARALAPNGKKGVFNKANAENDPELLKQAALSIMADKQKEKFVNALSLKKQKEIIDNYKKSYDMLEEQGIFGTKVDPKKRAVLAAASILSNINGFRMTGVKSAEAVAKSTQQTFNSKISELYAHYESGVFKGKAKDANDKALLEEMFARGQSNNTQMTKLAGIWEEASKFYVEAFNAAGGNIKFNKEWRVPQSHQQLAVKSAGKDKWVKDIKSKLDWEKMTDNEGNFIPPEKRDEILEEVYETITTNGVNKQQDVTVTDKGVEGARQGQGVSIRNKYQEERFLIFKDAESQFSYNKNYGQGSVMDSMFNYVNNIGYEVGLMEALGPKLGTSLEIVKQMARKRGAEDKAGGLHLIDNIWNIITKNGKEVANPAVANFFTLLRQNAITSFVGSFFTASVGDPGNKVVAARKFGLAGKQSTIPLMYKEVAKTVKQMAKQTDSFGQKGKELSVRRTGNVNHITYMNSQSQRFSDVTAEITQGGGGAVSAVIGKAAELQQNLNNWLYKRSLLTDFTEAGKSAAIGDVQDMLTTYRDTNWADIPKDIKQAMSVAGFDEKDLLLIQKADLEDVGGYETLTINSIMNSRGLTRKEKMEAVTALNTFGNTYANFAIPEMGAFQQGMLNLGGQAGSFGHEILKTILQLKSFPITYFHNQIMGDLRNNGGALNALSSLGYRAMIAAGFGTLAVQLTEVAKGNTPKPFIEATNAERGALIGEAWLKAGGLGILGDFLFKDFNEFGNDFTDFLTGPSVASLSNAMENFGMTRNTLMKSLGYEVTGETIDFDGGTFADVVDYGLDYGNLWYTKAVIHQFVESFLRKDFDPNYQTQKKKREKRLEENGQEYWVEDIFE